MRNMDALEVFFGWERSPAMHSWNESGGCRRQEMSLLQHSLLEIAPWDVAPLIIDVIDRLMHSLLTSSLLFHSAWRASDRWRTKRFTIYQHLPHTAAKFTSCPSSSLTPCSPSSCIRPCCCGIVFLSVETIKWFPWPNRCRTFEMGETEWDKALVEHHAAGLAG